MAVDLAALRKQLVTQFDLGELKTLCQDLGFSYDELPHETRTELARELVDFCDRRNQLDALVHVMAAHHTHTTTEPARPAPVRFLPADLPPGYVVRPHALATLRAALLGANPTVGVVATAALHGQGGLGKTVLARAICDDPAVQDRFPDGVLWATLGESPDPARHQANWLHALGGDPAAAVDPERGLVALRALLVDRAALLVIDDVWQAEAARCLMVAGPRGAVLITTRDKHQAHGAALVELALMDRDESRALLRVAAQGALPDPTLIDAIAARLGALPLALSLVGALLADGVPWSDIAAALDQGDVGAVEHVSHAALHRNLGVVLDRSVAALGADASRYRELVIFHRSQPLVEGAVLRLWQMSAGLRALAARRLLARLRALALLPANDTLHDLQHDYLRGVVSASEQRRLHALLADAYADPAVCDADQDRAGQPYGWVRRAWHLYYADRSDTLRDVLRDGRYLQGKLQRLGVGALLADYALLPGDDTLVALASALRLSAHVLQDDPRELESQLRGRLDAVPLVQPIPPTTPRLVLESTTLVRPGGPLRQTLAGHTGAVKACAFSPDRVLALSASSDGTLRVWEVATGQTRHVLKGHTLEVQACAFSPDGALALSASGDRTLRVWEVATGQTRHVLKGHTLEVQACAFSPDGALALSASGDRTLRVREVATGQTRHVLKGHTLEVQACAFSPDGVLALSASWDRTLRVWEVATGQTCHVLKGHTDGVNACAFSPDGALALSASDDRTLRVWKVATGQVRHVLNGHTDGVIACAFSPDGTLALSASDDRTLRVWEVATGQVRHVLNGHMGGVQACAFSSDGALALSASNDRTLRVWEVATGQALMRFTADFPLACAAFHPLALRVITGDQTGRLHWLRIKGA